MTSIGEAFRARSWLFAPGDSRRKMEKAAASAADIVILDLEDAVRDAAKAKARTMIADLLTARPGVGALGHRGTMLDRPHLARAQALLASGGPA